MNHHRILRMLICFMLCLSMVVQPLLIAPAHAAESANLIQNGTFADADSDGKADGWTYWFGSVAEAPSSLGEDGITITADSSAGAQRLTVHQTVQNLDASKTYKLSGRYNVISTGSGSLVIRYNTGTQIAKHTSKTDGWQTFTQEITGVDSIKLEIVVSEGATLTCSVDDISLTEVIAEPESYTVSFDANGGTGSMDGAATTGEYILPDCGFTAPEGKQFKAWKIGETEYAAGTAYTVTADTTVTAVWEDIPVSAPEYVDTLLKNGTFLDGNDDDATADFWTYWNGTAAAASSSLSEDGITITADSGSGDQRLTVHQTVTGLDAAKTYRFTGEYNVTSTSKGSLEIGYIPNASGSRTNAVKATSKTDGVKTFDVTFTDCASVKLEAAVSSGATLSCTLNNFKLEEVEVIVDDGNLLENPGFVTEDISSISNWNYYPAYAANAGTNYNASVADGVFTGNVLGGSNLILHQTVKLSEDQLNKKYTFTGDIKTEGLGSYAMFKIYVQDASNKQLSSFLSSQIKGDTDWTTLTLEFEVPESIGGVAVASIKLEQYILKGTGTAHFRNPKIIETGDFIPELEGDPVDSLLKNGGYETTLAGFPASWNLWTSTGGLNAVSDREVFKDGYSSLHLSNVTEGSDSRGSVHQTFTITSDLQELWGQSVKVGQWVKTENFVGDALALRVHYATISGSYISKSLPVKATQDWTYYEYIIDLPATFQTIKVETLYDYAQGDVWIDNTTCWGYIKATGINVNHDSLVLKAGETAQLELQYVPANTTVKEVSYATSNADVATVSETGLITAAANGCATITITHVDGTRKQIAVLVADSTLEYPHEISVSTLQNTETTGALPEGYTYSVTAAAQYGTFLVIGGDTYYYYPNKDFVGNDTVTLLATDAEGGQALVIAKLSVEAVNGAPSFDKMTIITKVGESVTGTFAATDPENDALTYTVVAQPANGTVTVEGNAYTFTPADGFQGYDEVTFRVNDSKDAYAEKTVTIYVAPDTEYLLNTVKSGHSRLLADNARFEELKGLIQTDANAKKWFADVKATIDPLLDDPTPVPYQCPDGVRLDTQGSKDVLNLAFMYRITGDEAYLERAKVELLYLCGLSADTYIDWHPSHLLDTAMTANGVAIAYDWLYDSLTAEEKAQVEEAIYQNALVEARKQFEANHMFVTNTENWNYICNGGFITAALAMAHHENEEYNALAGEIMQRCYASIQHGLPQYAPEGASIEGISYWDYGTRYLVSLLASISSATNTPNPFLDSPGLSLTAEYPIYLSGKAGSYNYSDNDVMDAYGYLNLWLAEQYGNKSWTWYHNYYMEKGNPATVYDLLYYNPAFYDYGDGPSNLDKYYTNQAVTTMRHDFTDPNSSFLGFKGGLNGAPHGDIDIGSFVYDIYGERWAFDFGKEDYNLVGYWEIAPGGTRWNYYRKNAMGHNTLVINPEIGANQTVGAYAGAVEQSINNPAGGYTILDMSDAYQGKAVAVKRGFAYFDRTQVLIRDEYTLTEFSDIYWQMHTKAAVTIAEDGKTATLTLNGKQIQLKLFDENGSNLKFRTMAAKPYEGLKTYDGENANEGVTKIYILAENVQIGTFNVLITPANMAAPEVKALDQWKFYDFSGICSHPDHMIDDHICTACGETLSQCADSNNDHICDVCDELLSSCKDAAGDKDHNCDICGKDGITECADTDHDHNCDDCTAVMTQCEDNTNDHKCDICGELLSSCTGGESTCNAAAVCDICGEHYGEKDPENHIGGTEIRNRKDATETEEGYTGDTYCLGCQELLEEGETIPVIPAPSVPSTPVKPSKPNWSNIFDKWFGNWWGNQEEQKCEHSYTAAVTEPTCTSKGYTTYTCSKCGESYKDTYTSALGHSWDNGVVTKEPTCTKDGVRTYSCSVCGHQKQESIKAIGHDYENGSCGNCGAQESTEPSNPSKPSFGNLFDWIFGSWWK